MSSTRNTPLTARSVLASVLLGTDPPWLPTPLLVRTTALFGISEGSTRTALSRLVTAGDAEATDGGYRLVGRLVARQQRQSASRLADTRPWDGYLGARHRRRRRPPAGGRSSRPPRCARRPPPGRAPRGRLGAAGQPRPGPLGRRGRGGGAMVRPLDRRPPRSGARRRLGVRTRGVVDDALAPSGTRSPGCSRRSSAATPPPCATGSSLSAAVLRHLQADPLLPDALLPSGWPGAALREEYDRYDVAYRSTLRAWFRAAR